MNKLQQAIRQQPSNYLLKLVLLVFVIALHGCASTKQPASANPVDPYEDINRKVYGFNDTVDDYVAKPVADTYKYVTPDFVETGVSNFFNNLKSINVVLNDVLQGKFEQGGRDTGRFLMNSTLGMAGLFDVAKSVGLEQNDEDFEQTLAVWGVPQGSYIVLPFLGPITTRGIPGAVFDSAANPVTYIGPLVPIQALSMINSRANAEGALKFIDEAALDPYVFTRESFLQWRNHLASDGKSETSANDLLDLEADFSDKKPSNTSNSLASPNDAADKASVTTSSADSASNANAARSPSQNKLDLVTPENKANSPRN